VNRNTEQKSTVGKQRFNIADVILIIIITAIIAALSLRIYNIFGTENDICLVEATFTVNGISDKNLHLADGAKLYSPETNEEVGYIKSFTVYDTTELVYNENGELVEAVVPGKKTIKGTVILTCEKTEHGFYIDSTKLLTVGESLHLYTATHEMVFTLNSVKEFSDKTTASSSTTAPAAVN
jgi:hypothetical protein